MEKRGAGRILEGGGCASKSSLRKTHLKLFWGIKAIVEESKTVTNLARRLVEEKCSTN